MSSVIGVLVSTLLIVGSTFGQEPDTMMAYIQETQSSQMVRTDQPTPILGSLHSDYSGLPNSCEVLIKVIWSSVNPSDRFPNVAGSTLPHVLGSDVAGVVVKAQDSCKTLNVGDQVYGDIGANTKTSSGEKTKELGGYGQYTVALESQLSIVPDSMDLQVAGALPKVALTSYKALVWYAGAKNDSLWKRSPTVMILGGSGGTGSVGIQMAKAFGAGKIIVTTAAANFDYCRSLGATDLIDYKTQNWWDASVVAENSVDVIYDCVGQQETGDRAMKKIRTGGYYVSICGALAMFPKKGVQQHDFINSDTNLDNSALWPGLNALDLKMPKLTSYPLSQMSEAFAASATGQTVGKIVIDVQNATEKKSEL